MDDGHAGVLAHREWRGRKHQQRRRAARRCHFGDTRRFEAAIRPDAVHQRQPVADLVLRNVEHAALFVE